MPWRSAKWVSNHLARWSWVKPSRIRSSSPSKRICGAIAWEAIWRFWVDIASRMLNCKKTSVEGARDTICRAYFCDFMEFLSRDIIACAKRIVFLFFCIVRNPQLSKHELSGSILRCTSKQPASITNFTLVYRNLVSASLLQLQKKLFLCFPHAFEVFSFEKKNWKKNICNGCWISVRPSSFMLSSCTYSRDTSPCKIT